MRGAQNTYRKLNTPTCSKERLTMGTCIWPHSSRSFSADCRSTSHDTKARPISAPVLGTTLTSNPNASRSVPVATTRQHHRVQHAVIHIPQAQRPRHRCVPVNVNTESASGLTPGGNVSHVNGERWLQAVYMVSTMERGSENVCAGLVTSSGMCGGTTPDVEAVVVGVVKDDDPPDAVPASTP